ncbi:MAG TPA: hypothetical protein VEO53_14725, partial [Candidatus Binatia bacterium]|nr:hypothetical protein [Candidatus Binatia bacterium]
DGFSDSDEVVLGFNPNLASSHPAIPGSYAAAVQAKNPVHWLRFEETTTANGVTNLGSSAPLFSLAFGPGILDADLGKPSAYTNLGRALEFTGPSASAATTKYIDFGQAITELVNLRSAFVEGKETTVEYWFKSTQHGDNGNNNWQNPSILARESPGDGDMYWGNFNSVGDFIFSTSDLHDIHVTNGYATDGRWHHVVLSKTWHTNAPCLSRLFMDGGALFGGKTIETATAAGPAASGQDDDGAIQFLGFTQSGELASVQYIGLIDEVAVYTNAFLEADARIHYIAGGGQPLTGPLLQFQKVGSNLILSWPYGTLQSAATVTGTWSIVTGASSFHTNAITGGQEFFRLQVP